MTSINQFYTDIAFHPGETLDEKLMELNMGPKEFALRTGKPEKTIIAIIKGDSSITPEMAILFESVLKIPATFWIKRQLKYDEFKAREKRNLSIQEAIPWAKNFPYTDMVKVGWIAPQKKIEDKVVELFHFFGLSSPDAWEDYYFNQQLKIAFRISLAHTKEAHALSSWIQQGEHQANQLQCGEYSERSFKSSLPEIKQIMATQPDDFFEQLQKICLQSGVKLVYTPCISKAPLSGATRWINNHPLIQLSGRHKQNDRFWFTFFHEAAHILLHGKKDIFIEDIHYSDTDQQKENEANQFAEFWTFSKEQEKEVLQNKPLNAQKMKHFAQKFHTHPAMIIGRLQKLGHFSYSEGSQYFVKLNFEEIPYQ